MDAIELFITGSALCFGAAIFLPFGCLMRKHDGRRVMHPAVALGLALALGLASFVLFVIAAEISAAI